MMVLSSSGSSSGDSPKATHTTTTLARGKGTERVGVRWLPSLVDGKARRILAAARRA